MTGAHQAAGATLEPGRSRLDALLRPRSIAIVGASDDPARVGGMPLRFLDEVGYPGAVFPVSVRHREVQGHRAYARVGDIPEPVDLAVIAVAAQRVPEVVEECAAAGVGAAVVFSAGFAETGPAGEALQDELAEIAARTGIRILGPNCAGIMNVPLRMTASFGSHLASDTRLIPGPIAVVSQSGAVGAYLFTLARRRGCGLSHWVTTGNEVDAQAADFVRAIAGDPGTRVIALYLEQVRDAAALMEACEAARERGTALVGVLAGRSEASERAMRSHTAAMTGDRAVAAAALEEMGIVPVHSIDALLTTSIALAGRRRPAGPGVGVVTISGAAGIMMVDRCADLGMHVPPLADAAQRRIKERLPYAAAENPVDVTGNISNTPEIFAPVLHEVLAADDVDALVCFLGHVTLSPSVGRRLVEDLAAAAAGTDKPVWLVGVIDDASAAVLADADIPLLSDPVAAVDALDAAARSRAWREGGPGVLARRRALDGTPAAAPPAAGPLSEADAIEYLEQAGVRFPEHESVTSPGAAAAAAARLGGTLAMKVVSRDIAHKTEAGGVRLGVAPPDAGEAYEAIVRDVAERAPGARVEGVLVQRQLEGHPVIVGTMLDDTFGPVVLVGSGGIYTELLADRALALAPVDAAGAEALIERTRLPGFLSGARGGPALARDQLVQLIVAASELAWSGRVHLSSIELNPVLVGPHDAVAVDALIETKGTDDGP